MSRNYLAIKGADCSENKVATVTFVEDEKPCTAIELDITSKTVTSMEPFTLTPTVTPADTTDDIIWSSSDPSVATVANGVVTMNGLGSVTITATCGSYSATCAVDASELTMVVAFGFFEWQSLTNYPDMYAYKTSKRKLLAHALTGTKYLKNQTSDATLRYPIAIPNGADVVKVSYNDQMRAGTIDFGWLDSQISAYPSQYPDNAGLVSLDQTHSSAYGTAKTWEYDVPEGADSFAVTLVTNSSDFADSDTPDGIALAKGIVIKCAVASS